MVDISEGLFVVEAVVSELINAAQQPSGLEDG